MIKNLLFCISLIGTSSCFGQFTELVSAPVVTPVLSTFGMAWGDYDNDDIPDLYYCNFNNTDNELWDVSTVPDFTAITGDPAVMGGSHSSAASFGDFNNDGFLDILVGNWNGDNQLFMNDGSGGFTEVSSGILVTDGGTSYGCSWVDANNDGLLDAFFANGTSQLNQFYMNNGDTTWTEVTTGPIVADATTTRCGVWSDYNGDGDADLFVGQLGGANNYLFENDGSGIFTSVTTDPVVLTGGDSYGGSWGDYNNDGDMDLFVANRGSAGEVNFLYENDGSGNFTSIISGAIVTDVARSHASSWVDYDNDGWLDLYVGNGAIEDNDLYQNNGDGTFTAITTGIVVNDGGHTFGAGFADYNNDGYMDLALASDFATVNAIYLNDGGSNNWVHVSLEGVVSNGAALGAKVWVHAGGITQLREISGQTGHASQNDLRAHFGLGTATTIDSIVISWPSCLEMTFYDVAINQTLDVQEGLISEHPTDMLICENDPFTLSVNTYNGGYAYQWQKDNVDLTDGGTISGATTNTLTISSTVLADAGDYTCEVTASCAPYTEESQIGVVDVQDCLGLDNWDALNLTIMPNPANDQAIINFDRPMISLSIYELSGRKVSQWSVNGMASYQLDLSELAAGTYIVRVVAEEGSVAKKLVVE